MADVQADGSDDVEGCLDVEYGSGDQGFEVQDLSGCHSAPQVDAANHVPQSSGRLPRTPRAVYCADHGSQWLPLGSTVWTPACRYSLSRQ
jgi:hypothetical protein